MALASFSADDTRRRAAQLEPGPAPRLCYTRKVHRIPVETMKTSITSAQEQVAAEPAERDRVRRYRRAADLLRKWEEDPTGYDDEVWPLLEEELPTLGVRCPE